MTQPAFRRLMTHDVTIIPRKRDAFGSWSDGAAVPAKGFVEYALRRAVNRDGEEVAAAGTVFLPASAEINPSGRYSVEHEGRRKDVITVDRLDDPRTGKTHHYELAIL